MPKNKQKYIDLFAKGGIGLATQGGVTGHFDNLNTFALNKN